MRITSASSMIVATLALAACGEHATLAVKDGMGPEPTLVPPNPTLIPTLKIAPAIGWAAGATPTAAPGLAVNAFATGLDHPRWLYVLPNGDVLVAESNGPARPEDGRGIKAWFKKKAMKKAGAAAPSANRISLLRDADGDGVAETRTTLLSGLNSPFGMVLVGGDLYVANTDALLRFPYHDGDTRIEMSGTENMDPPGGALERNRTKNVAANTDGARPYVTVGTKVVDLPGGPLNHHWTKNVIASNDGSHLYVTVGSNSNVAENGIEKEAERAAIWQVDPKRGTHRVFASGLRNPNGMAWQPQTGMLWTAVNERDEIGSDLVPDYMTSVVDGGFYGWPYSYYGQHIDVRVEPQRPDLVAKAIAPDYALGPHTASLGLTFSSGSLLPRHYANGAFVGQHGSWNRKPQSGYKVIFVPFTEGKPSGAAEDVLTEFLDAEGNARGRPVGVVMARSGALLVADDVGNVIWRVAPRE